MIIFIAFFMLLTGCTNKATTTEKDKSNSLSESIQGHWEDNGGANYYISDQNFVLKDTDGSIRRFTYLIMVENPEKNYLELKLKTVEGNGGASRKIQFTDKERKTADVSTFIEGIDIELDGVWNYVDSKQNP
jgi:hypothetical protein